MAKYRITSPDGQKYDITAPDNATQEQVMEYAKKQFASQEPEQQKDPNAELKSPVTGMRSALDATASVASGAVAAPVSGLAGIAGAVLPGPQGQGADWQQKTQQALTYQPQTQGGQQIVNAVSAPFAALAGKADQAGGAVTDATGSPALGAATNAAVQAVPAVAGKVLGRARPTIEATIARRKQAYDAKASRDSVKNETWRRGAEEGYRVPAPEIESSPVTKQVINAGGKAAVKQEFIQFNQQITDKIARREAGLAENEPIDEQTLKAARAKMSAPYDELAALSPRAADALEKFKQAKFNAKEQWNFYNRTGNPEVRKIAEGFDAEADTAEKLMTMHAKKAGRQDLLPRLEAARIQLAKNYEVERALNVGTGSVDAQYFAREINKKGVDRYSGGLQTIGLFAKRFRNYTADDSKIYLPGASHLDAVGSAAAIVTGHTLAGGLPLLRGPMRSLALSEMMQPSTGLKPYSPGLGLRAGLNLTDQGITDPAALLMMSEEKRKRLGL